MCNRIAARNVYIRGYRRVFWTLMGLIAIGLLGWMFVVLAFSF